MIDFYTWSTPNGRKVSIMLEECGLEYKTYTVDIGNEEQFRPEFIAVSPNNRIPAIVDPDGPGGQPLALMESAAIMIYLSEKTGKFLPGSGAARAKVMEWSMWQMGNIGPMLGQAGHFVNYSEEKIEYAINRYVNESARLLRILDDQLGKEEFMAGDYSIADMLTYPWIVPAWTPLHALKKDVIGEGANITRWMATMGARPAVSKGMAVPDEYAVSIRNKA